MGAFAPTYQIVEAPEPAWTWKDYEQLILREWRLLLDASPSEASVHEFFERHPSLLPGAFEISGGESGHYPWLTAVISRPPLPSYAGPIPDFLWLSNHSSADVPVLVEIEAPRKKWFTKKGQPTAAFTQALDQIKEWKAWFGTSRNVDAFKDFYQVGTGWFKRSFAPEYILIYGRRQEATSQPRLAAKRAQMEGPREHLMTYDRLTPNPKSDEIFSVGVDSEGSVTAIHVPPTMTLTPMLADVRSKIHGKADAIGRNQYLSDVRKQFLISRISYWDEWGTREDHGTINTGHYE